MPMNSGVMERLIGIVRSSRERDANHPNRTEYVPWLGDWPLSREGMWMAVGPKVKGGSKSPQRSA